MQTSSSLAPHLKSIDLSLEFVRIELCIEVNNKVGQNI